jgi:hypothetical protein
LCNSPIVNAAAAAAAVGGVVPVVDDDAKKVHMDKKKVSQCSNLVPPVMILRHPHQP